MTKLVVLLGDPVAHSLSPWIQNHAFRVAEMNGVYVALRTDATDLGGLLHGIARAGGAGNVTIPHKEAAHREVDRLAQAARRTWAVNTFWLQDGVIHGDNTDVTGFRHAATSLFPGGLDGARVVLIGAGGAARAVLVALEELGVSEVRIRNRNPERALQMIRELVPVGMEVHVEDLVGPIAGRPELVVNATSLGLAPDDPLPVPIDQLPAGSAVLDLVYHPAETRWVRLARERGLKAADGGEMLIGQGAASFERWWGKPAPIDAYRNALDRIRDRAGAP